jgi:autotransporter-associated beta strand protein
VTINAGSAVGAQAADTLTIIAAAGANPTGTGISDLSTSGAHTINANVILGGTQTWTNNSTGTLTIGGGVNLQGFNLTVNGTGNILSTGVVTGTGNVTVNGSGAFTLEGSASNTYSGTTFVNSGTLALDMATGTAIVGDGASSKSVFDISVGGGTLVWEASNQLDPSVSIGMTAGTVNINGFNETFYDFTNSGAVFETGNGLNKNTVNVTDPTLVAGTTTISSGTTATFGSLNIQGGTNTVQGDGGTGQGGAVLNVGSNLGLSFTGTGNPTLTINSDATSAGQVVLQGDITANANSNGSIAEGGTAANLGTLDLGNATRTVSTATGSTLTIAVPITDVANHSNGLNKTGPGTLILNGNNTYQGDTNVNAGKVVVGGKIAGKVNVMAGSILSTGNNLTAQIGALDVSSVTAAGNQGGIVEPGDSGGPGLTTIGQLNVTGNVTLGTTLGDASTAHLSLEIGGVQDGTGVGAGGPNTTNNGALQYDRVAMGGTLTLNSVTLDISLVNSYTFTNPSWNNSTQQFNLDGHIFFLITGATGVSGTFANDSGIVDQNVPGPYTTLNSNGQLFAISYDASFSAGTFSGGDDVAVMAIPEPNSMSMLAGSLGLALGLQRFRRRRMRSGKI